MAYDQELSFTGSLGGTSQKVAISSTSAQSAALGSGQSGGSIAVRVTPDTDCYYRQGSNPTALSTGVDDWLMAQNTYRITVVAGNKLAFITESASGYVRITPES